MDIPVKLNGLDLFSGIGGISLALSEWVRPVAYCEREQYAQAVLLSRMQEGTLGRAGIWDDVTTLSRDTLGNVDIDIIYGGFPCQDISVAGAGKGLEGERSGLFFEIVRLAREIRPRFIFLENVPAIRTRGLDKVLQELAKAGYDYRWCCLSAAEVGANHKRERWFLLAHSQCERGEGHICVGGERRSVLEEGTPTLIAEPDQISSPVAYSSRELSHGGGIEGNGWPELADTGWWAVEPDLGRVVNELPRRVDRLKCLGNAVVPLQAKEAFKRLMGIK